VHYKLKTGEKAASSKEEESKPTQDKTKKEKKTQPRHTITCLQTN
jgi:hypothetical protein